MRRGATFIAWDDAEEVAINQSLIGSQKKLRMRTIAHCTCKATKTTQSHRDGAW
jgi:hypothetical protein